MSDSYSIKNILDDRTLEYQTSDPQESIFLYADHCTVEAGGFVDTAGTHYARMKDEVSIPVGVKFWQTAVIDLPVNFYEQRTASLKVMTAGDSVGTYRRIGLWIDSEGFPRLQSETKGKSLIILWRGGRQLPLGKHAYAIEYVASARDGEALMRLYVDGAVWGESTQANYSAAEVNRLVWGIDGAASQDVKRLSLTLWSVGLNDYIQVDPCIVKRERLLKAKVEMDNARAELKTSRFIFNVARAEYLDALANMDGC